MRYGISLLLWTDELTDEALPLLDHIKAIGYDAVELPISTTDVKTCDKWGKCLDNAGLARTGNVIRGVEDNPISPHPKVRCKGIDNNKAAVECCQAMGAETLVGPYHSTWGHFSGAAPTGDEWRWAVEGMRQVAEHAEKLTESLPKIE